MFPRLTCLWNHFLQVIFTGPVFCGTYFKKASQKEEEEKERKKERKTLLLYFWSLHLHVPPFFPSKLMSWEFNLWLSPGTILSLCFVHLIMPSSHLGIISSFFFPPFPPPHNSFLLTHDSGSSFKMYLQALPSPRSILWHARLKRVDTLHLGCIKEASMIFGKLFFFLFLENFKIVALHCYSC